MLDAYEEYKRFCIALGVVPCALDDWQVSIALLDGQHIPYISGIGTVWVHDIRKKTRRTDKPYNAFLAQSLQEKPLEYTFEKFKQGNESC